ncbi:MAG: hypothetical protein ACKO2V_10680 [Snowella sp.]
MNYDHKRSIVKDCTHPRFWFGGVGRRSPSKHTMLVGSRQQPGRSVQNVLDVQR